MKLIIGNWCFSPKIVTSLLALLFFYLFISLGLWQLDRAEYKKNLYLEFESRQIAEAIDFNLPENFQLEVSQLLWRNILAEGEFLEKSQILLDNQVENTKAGYFVYTPFRLFNSNKVVLVNKGWVLADKDRSVVPALEYTQEIVKIIGVIKEIPKTGLLLKETPPEKMNEQVYRVQRINTEELGKLTKEKISPYIIRLEPESEHGYVRNWRVPGSDESKHKGYAFQWFAFAAALLLIYLILNIKKKVVQTNE
jgi:surfeit locus 1 family protein